MKFANFPFYNESEWRRKMKIAHQYFVILVLLSLFIVGCAHLPGKTKSEESLRKKVNQEWVAKVNGDWGTVYDLATKEFKQKVERDKFLRGANLKVVSFSVKELTIDKAQGKAQVLVSFDINQMRLTFKGATLKEEWIWEDGEWRLNLNPNSSPFATK